LPLSRLETFPPIKLIILVEFVELGYQYYDGLKGKAIFKNILRTKDFKQIKAKTIN
jgi:hypothetical protein